LCLKAKKEAKTISDQKAEMRRVRDRVAAKNELLREMTAGTIEALDLSALKPRWETFSDLLTVFDEMLHEQRSTLVQDIEKKIKGAACVCVFVCVCVSVDLCDG
jgi:hypothetical protein